MLRIIAFILLSIFLFRIVGSVIRFLLGGASMNRPGSFQQGHQRSHRGSNVHVDYNPKKDPPKKGNFKGGEYVDYEDLDK